MNTQNVESISLLNAIRLNNKLKLNQINLILLLLWDNFVDPNQFGMMTA